ncbi:MAG: hypothetical protein NTW21_31305 [Verrucomicrobia bacterium]|nr:hypothetical protein [Verrucomicrobiota bacterium]
MIQTPIRQVLLTIQKHQVQALLMGGQACVFYGAAQFSKDVDFLILAEATNFLGLQAALAELQAVRIAVPRFDPEVLQRGHAVHFRCQAPGVEGLRIDVMTRLRDLPSFAVLWDRRTTVATGDGGEVNLLAVPDLVNAKKTQRDKDWPMIGALVEGHYTALESAPTPERILFWLAESRTPERLIDLTARFPAEAASAAAARPLLALARADTLPELRTALDAEVRAEQDKDRAYWEPLKREMEAFSRAEREA